jgi:hypothetical protein
MALLDELRGQTLEQTVQNELCDFISKSIIPQLAILSFKIKSAQRLHLMEDTRVEDLFRICHYDLRETTTTAITCDEDYIFLGISANNGGIYKIGTGNGLTKAGKIYLFKPIKMTQDQPFKMVVIGDTLYQNSANSDFDVLKTYNKNTLEYTGDIELSCPKIKSDPSNIRINRSVPLMTDGQHLYVIFKTLDLDPIDESQPIPEPVPVEAPNNQFLAKNMPFYGGDQQKNPELIGMMNKSQLLSRINEL